MTTVLTYINDKFSIILSDDRVNYGRNQEYGYEDGITKLVDLDYMGWASGAGLVDYLDDLKYQLMRIKPKTTDDIKNVYKNVIKNFHKRDPDYIEDANESVLIASWIGFDPETSSILLRNGSLCQKHFGEKLIFASKGIIDIIYPGDYLNDLTKVDQLKGKFNLQVEGDIGTIINNMLEIFKEISNNSTQVSKHCDIGIMSVVDRPQEWIVYKHKMSGNATELINSYNEGTFENKIDVVGATNIPKNIRV